PIGRPAPWRPFLPGNPVRPLPMPHPIVRPGPQPFPAPQPWQQEVALADYKVEGKVDGRSAELTYDMVFRNPGGMRMEGVLLLPIPADASVERFTMTVGGKEQKAELLDAGQ